MPTIAISDAVMAILQELAAKRQTDVPGVLAEAIGLERLFVEAQESGSRFLIEKGGRLEELVPPTPLAKSA